MSKSEYLHVCFILENIGEVSKLFYDNYLAILADQMCGSNLGAQYLWKIITKALGHPSTVL